MEMNSCVHDVSAPPLYLFLSFFSITSSRIQSAHVVMRREEKRKQLERSQGYT